MAASDAIVIGEDWISEHYFTTDATSQSFHAQVLGRRKVWDDQSKPLPLPVGVQPSFTDVQLSRGVDTDSTLYKWISKIAQKGATPDTVKDVTLIACDAEGSPVHTYVLKQAFPVSYGAGGMNAAGTDVLTEQLTLKYTDFTMDDQGGLLGPVD